MTLFDILTCAIIGYFIGGFSTAITFSILVQHRDIRGIGSGNAGATNMLRNFGWIPGLITFFVDVLKGALVTFIGLRLYMQTGAVLCGVFAIIGHTYPVYYGFKGGKGIAVTIGMMAILSPMLLLYTAVITLIVILVTRIISVGSITGNFVLVILNWIFNTQNLPVCIGMTVACVLNLFSHRSNIQRLIKGEESKMNWRELSRPQIHLRVEKEKNEQKNKAGDGT